MNEIDEIILTYNMYIKKVPNGCQVIVNKLRANTIENAMLDITDFTDGIEWIFRVNAYLSDVDNVPNIPKAKIDEFLKEVNLGLEYQDYFVVADIFEYEIIPLFNDLIIESRDY